MKITSLVTLAVLTLAVAEANAQASQPNPAPKERAAQLKQWMQFSAQQIRRYEWIETTVISKGGEEKLRVQKRCFYGADGQLQKIELASTAPEKKGMPGILPLGKLVNKGVEKRAEKKKEEITRYMHDAQALLHNYIPPVPSVIQRAIEGGKLAVQVLEPNRRVRLQFTDYLKAGDSLGVDIELPTNRLLAMSATTYVDGPSDAVSLDVTMSVMPDGTIFPAQALLKSKSQDLSVTVENANHRPVGQ